MESKFNLNIPEDFDQNSRVWLYQSDRSFTQTESDLILQQLNAFTAEWNTHGDRVKGHTNIFFDWFIVLMADETQAGVSGCSTDSSVRQMKLIEQKFNVSLFERQNLAFLVNGGIQIFHLNQIQELIESGALNGETIYFNNLVQTKNELLNNWMVPLKNSWLAKRFEIPSAVS